MKAVAYMPVLNEADIVQWPIRHLIDQGLRVHVIDGWSTDGSAEIAADAGATVERFPASGRESIQVCSAINNRIEYLAARSGADWCYHTDADEIRRAPRASESLLDAIARVDAEGWNVVDHQTFVFFPVDDSDGVSLDRRHSYQGENPEQFFRYFTSEDGRWSRVRQEKLWKNDAPVRLAGGGHILDREDKRVCPEKFVLKHFPWRSVKHAEEKLRVRMDRRCLPEHAQGGGVHYDGLTGESAILPKSQLRYWADPFSPKPREINLNLGCSDALIPGFQNVDMFPPADLLADLTKPWPWPEGSINAIRAHDIIEHLPDKVHTMNEAYRVLRPGGHLEIIVPTTDGRAAFQDPQHVSFWNRHSFWYYEAGNIYRDRFCKANGVKAAFRVLGEQDISSQDGPKLGILLEAVKN